MQSYPLSYQLTHQNFNQPILLMLHGFMGSHLDFQECVSLLSQRFCCLTVDLPGHGNSQVQENENIYTIQGTAIAIINLLNSLKISTCNLLGYSMGGRLALYLKIHYPRRFDRVILESASPGLKTEMERKQRLKVDLNRAKRLERDDFNHFLTDWYNQPLFDTLKHHPKFNQIFNDRLKNNPLNLAKSLRNLGTGRQPALWENLPSTQSPLLLMVGEKDHKFVKINQKMAQRSPTATLEIIPNCGHNIHLEKPEDWLKTVQSFYQLD